MIEYSHLSAKVWKQVSNHCFSGSNSKKNEAEYVHWQILQWAESIPEYLKLPEKQQLPISWSPASSPNRAVQRLQCLLYLRANLMRMLVYQPALLSASAISQNTSEADMMVEIAKETIRFIFNLNETSNIYRLQQVTFNYFLVSALAVILLAIAHAPSRYSAQCKEEFYLALELVKKFSVKYRDAFGNLSRAFSATHPNQEASEPSTSSLRTMTTTTSCQLARPKPCRRRIL